MMKQGKTITFYSMKHPKKIIGVLIVLTMILGMGASLPSIWPRVFTFAPRLKVDTDPENMLSSKEPVRVLHNQMKKEFSLNEIIVLGIVNEKNPNGVFNPDSLKKIFELTNYAKTIQWEDGSGKVEGVVSVDIIAPSTVDNISQGGAGEVKFEWLMNRPPETLEEALAIRTKAMNIPFLNGTLVSENGRAICLYIPLTSKDVSYQVSQKLMEKIQTFQGEDDFYITGLPVANDTFGVEMFKQMAVSAPIAMLVIFLLLFYFFRKLILIISPMILAIISVICTMGLLVITGNTVHIMSSMIPIFIMPIAVLDSVHILSEFFDRYPKSKNRTETLTEVMEELFMPMLYTSLTSVAGFASLALTPIPPVQVFGIFIAIGVSLAWLFTVTFIPAYIMLIPEGYLKNFGKPHDEAMNQSVLSGFLQKMGRFTYYKVKWILTITAILVIIAGFGIFRIQVNDNPVKWFGESHPIREADRVLNKHFGGTYMAYLFLEGELESKNMPYYVQVFKKRMNRIQNKLEQEQAATDISKALKEQIEAADRTDKTSFLNSLKDFVILKMDEAGDEEYYIWEEWLIFLEGEEQREEIFKDPSVLKYISDLQVHLLKTGVVGKSNSLADVVKTVYRELYQGKEEYFKIPETREAVAQSILTYQNSHRPQDLWHFVTPDYRKNSLWVQLKSGNNKDMTKVVKSVKNFFEENPPPMNLKHKWFGLTYINVVWQERMVTGMLKSFLGSFLVVFLMMTVLFRSALWGILSMIPLTVTIGVIYGAVGLVGKDYDMPIAVLSSLTLGLAVDFAIHFLARSKELVAKSRSWKEASTFMFDEPARAISKNIIVIAVGFIPLLAAPLIPYKTVGVFLATILTIAGISTLFILPALIKIMEAKLFPKQEISEFACKCVSCIITGITAVLVVYVNFQDFLVAGWGTLAGISLAFLILIFVGCRKLSSRKRCQSF